MAEQAFQYCPGQTIKTKNTKISAIND